MRGGWSSPTPYTPMDGENKAITTKKKKKKKKKKICAISFPTTHICQSSSQCYQLSRDMGFPTMCDQKRLRPAYVQSDQSLCLSLEYSMDIKLLTEHHLEFLSLKGKAAQAGLSHTCQNATLLEIVSLLNL